jgi:hypothetical protein
MLGLLLVSAGADTNLTIADFAVGIMSGKELLLTRFLSQAASWGTTFGDIYVYSDAFPGDTRAEIAAAAPHTTIHFVEIANRSEHIIGSPWLREWYQAQPRFLPAIHHLWRANPGVRWYLVGDDDTYFYIRNIMRRLSKVNSSAMAVVSFFWCSWEQVTEFMEPLSDCHLFAQGGAGVVFSKTMMDRLAPHLPNCSEKYNDAEHAASMRVAVCVERLWGYENWTKGAFAKPWRSGMHPTSPAASQLIGNTWDAPGSFHQVAPEDMARLSAGHIVEEADGFYDFAHIAFRPMNLELTYRRKWEMYFGYSFDNFGTHTQRKFASSALWTDDGGKTFLQEFEGNVTVVVHCDAEVEENEIRVEDVIRGPNTTVHLAVRCPGKQPYYR